MHNLIRTSILLLPTDCEDTSQPCSAVRFKACSIAIDLMLVMSVLVQVHSTQFHVIMLHLNS